MALISPLDFPAEGARLPLGGCEELARLEELLGRGREGRVHRGDLRRVDRHLAVEAHVRGPLRLLAAALDVLQVREDGVDGLKYNITSITY